MLDGCGSAVGEVGDQPSYQGPAAAGGDIPDRVIDAGTREALAEFLTAYPAVARHDSYVVRSALSLGPQAPPDFTRYRRGGGELVFNRRVSQESVTTAERQARTYGPNPRLRRGPVLPAGPAPMKRELHPLMVWWAVLYTLSMLARYEPATWSTLISVDNSQHAVAIERLLERAINHVPVLIADTIDEVST
ncbi:hypothetical protein ADK77_05140 [Streptomyces antibioticus]|nr:hypothetical protein ADK77_05140 [Streptomyces antibioticus]